MLKLTTSIKRYAKENNLQIIDARGDVRLSLTKDDVRKGDRANPQSCGFARCATRTQRVDKAFFLRSTAYLEKDGQLARYILPPSMTKEIIAFDRGATMEPGVYKLNAPPKSQGLDAMRGRMKKLAAKRRSAKKASPALRPGNITRHRTTGIRTGIVVG